MSKYNPSDEVLIAMINKAKEKLNVAKREYDMKYYNEVSSRAYYAVFHSISAILAEKGLTFKSHSQTIGAFNRDFVKTKIFPSNTFRKIQRLFDNRQMSDYDWNSSFDEEEAGTDINDAELIINNCIKYLNKTRNLQL